MKRSDLRETLFRVLFRYEFHANEEFTNQLEMFFEQYPEQDDDEQNEDNWPALNEKSKLEISARIGDLLAHISDIDAKITESTVGWTIDRIGKAELSILRIAVYEILYDDTIELPVAINEAVNLSKKYCDEKAHGFVNGVLAKLA